MEKVMFASEKTDWETPLGLFNELNREFGFTRDVCATGCCRTAGVFNTSGGIIT